MSSTQAPYTGPTTAAAGSAIGPPYPWAWSLPVQPNPHPRDDVLRSCSRSCSFPAVAWVMVADENGARTVALCIYHRDDLPTFLRGQSESNNGG